MACMHSQERQETMTYGGHVGGSYEKYFAKHHQNGSDDVA